MTDDYRYLNTPGVFEQPDGAAIVVFASDEASNGVRRKLVPAAAMAVIRDALADCN